MSTTRTFAFLAPLASLALAACGAPAPAVPASTIDPAPSTDPVVEIARGPAPVEPAAKPATRPEVLVWTRDADGGAVTHRLALDGRELGVEDGILVATRSGVLRWTASSVEVETTSCPIYAGEGEPTGELAPEPGHATRIRLVDVGGADEQTVIDPEIDGDGSQSYEHGVVLVASVGPYLFVHESTYVYGCGAHGNASAASSIWDASRRSFVELSGELDGLAAARAAASEELTDEDDLEPVGDAELELTELVPSFGRGGELTLGYQLTAPTCYACTRGSWSSYTKSTVVPARSLPKSLARFAEPPAALRAFAAAHPDVEIGGVSVVGGELDAR